MGKSGSGSGSVKSSKSRNIKGVKSDSVKSTKSGSFKEAKSRALKSLKSGSGSGSVKSSKSRNIKGFKSESIKSPKTVKRDSVKRAKSDISNTKSLKKLVLIFGCKIINLKPASCCFKITYIWIIFYVYFIFTKYYSLMVMIFSDYMTI